MLILLIAVLASPDGLRRRKGKNSARAEAVNNAKQILLALLDHQERYGSFPNEKTMQKIAKEKGIAPFPLTTSNDYFRLLLAGGAASEKMGYCSFPSLPTHRPDDVISPLEQAFARGEVGFAYVANLPADSHGDTPVLVAPLIPGTFQFDPKPFDGRAVVLKMDGSTTTMTIREDNGLVSIRGGKTLFDPSAPYWNGKMPDVKYPAR
ncbi:hypothetical protein OKA05_20390 [Luteolibacter arcticus]|uniref:Uncharacterized protein n=1 Tax=Luteolibacter arcticus TaxID=1581411 RepID=A0ABT3GN52_9BACT|nr:hypothetical protein [Luteolibacter arcticus]MCW1924933.1 hypothetical protein [Luteolibacter arcticus]